VLFGDVDNDGDTDAVILNNSGPARLLLNQVGAAKPWVGVRLLESSGARDAHATRLVVDSGGGALRWRRVRVDGSYAASNDPRVLVGLGAEPRTVAVRVLWQGGPPEKWERVRAGSYTVLHRTPALESR
jgi:ASPIC and UnbV